MKLHSKNNGVLNRCSFYTIEEISAPKHGYMCYTNHWWALNSDGKVIIYNRYSPQCNSDKEIAGMISEKLYSGDIVFIPIAYIEIDSRV